MAGGYSIVDMGIFPPYKPGTPVEVIIDDIPHDVVEAMHDTDKPIYLKNLGVYFDDTLVHFSGYSSSTVIEGTSDVTLNLCTGDFYFSIALMSDGMIISSNLA